MEAGWEEEEERWWWWWWEEEEDDEAWWCEWWPPLPLPPVTCAIAACAAVEEALWMSLRVFGTPRRK